ncbi:MAG: hypothetical protein LBT46_12620 [Planctomycetaceae bacterium]|jgi:hypothetical protein|nr:hypothetical protein [Planctomycetaceae bacterium]
MDEYVFELYLTDVPEAAVDDGFDTLCERFYEVFGEDGSLAYINGEWSISVDVIGYPSWETAVSGAVRKIKKLGFGISRLVLDAEQVARLDSLELIGA